MAVLHFCVLWTSASNILLSVKVDQGPFFTPGGWLVTWCSSIFLHQHLIVDAVNIAPATLTFPESFSWWPIQTALTWELRLMKQCTPRWGYMITWLAGSVLAADYISCHCYLSPSKICFHSVKPVMKQKYSATFTCYNVLVFIHGFVIKWLCYVIIYSWFCLKLLYYATTVLDCCNVFGCLPYVLVLHLMGKMFTL